MSDRPATEGLEARVGRNLGRLLTAQSAGRPEWMGGRDFSVVKLRLIGSIAAIRILEIVMHIDEVTSKDAGWQLASCWR